MIRLAVYLLTSAVLFHTVEAETTGPTNGSLVIMGGGGSEIENIFGRFVELAGGKQAKIVIVPTAASSDDSYDYANHRSLRMARERLALSNVEVVHTHDRQEADTEEFAARVRTADGVWFTGGRQWRLADAYLGTLTEEAFHEVLQRGGVIGGSSAGATIQGSFLARGDTQGNSLMVGDHQHGFAFVTDCAIDQHLVARGRQAGLIDVLTDPEARMETSFDRGEMLGLGIDEDTAIIVQGNQLEVIGKPDGRLLVYDPRSWKVDTPDHKKYQTLFVGTKYDLASRARITTDRVVRASKRPRTSEGYYKEIFMSGGVQLSSRRRLPAAQTLGLSYEYYAGKDKDRQTELIVGSEIDTNGVLLYPDGQPRFRMIFVNGGAATLHGKSLGKSGREVLRQFHAKGGSYCGSCAGSFLSGHNTDARSTPRLGYLHIFPFNTLNTGMQQERVGHFIPQDSPLMQYRDFGGDGYVADIYHNNGNWLNAEEGKHLEVTEILAIYDAPAKKCHGGAAVWAYKAGEQTGRIVNIGSHPEAITHGERLDLTEACFLYALDGVAPPAIKGTLVSGVTRKMDKDTSDNDPAYTKIGDRQCHHFRFEVVEDARQVVIDLVGQPGIDFNIYLKQGTPAMPGNAVYSNVGHGSNTRIEAELEPGQWYVSVECATTVTACKDEVEESFIYSGNTDVLNGVSYQITMTAE